MLVLPPRRPWTTTWTRDGAATTARIPVGSKLNLGKPQTLCRAFISEPYGRVREYELQVWKSGQWQTFYRGTTIGENRTLVFAPLTGQRVRLNVVKATEGPSIWEFQLFGAEK